MAPMSKTHRIVLAIGLLCLGAAGGAAAQGTAGSASGTASGGTAGSTAGASAATGRSGTPGSSQAADRAFMEKAATSDMAEIQLSQIAQQKATRDDVKQLAGRMVQDHTRTSQELKSIAGKHNATLPTALDRKHQQAVEKLQGKTASADFDRQYLKLLLDDHRQAVSLFRAEAKSGKNPEAKAFAAKTLPALEEHLQMVQAMSKGAGKPMAMGGAGAHPSAGAKPGASGATARP